MSHAEHTALSNLTLEELVTGKGYADLPASPLQRAVCRAVCGQVFDDLLTPDERGLYFGTTEPAGEVPTIVELVAGVRGGKSFLLACAAIRSSIVANLSKLKKHEIPRAVIIGPTVDAARATFVLLLGILQSSPVLKRLIKGEPTSDTVVIKRPDGRCVEICVVAAHRGGLSVRNRWLVFFGLEEVALFGAEVLGAAVSVEALFQAAVTRLLLGCQGWLISSPQGPSGLLHELWKKHFGKPGRVLVVHAPTRALNPSFPQEQIDAIDADDPDIGDREYRALWLDADSAFLPSAIVDPATRTELYLIGRATAVGMDTATRGNSWTLCAAWANRRDRNTDRVRVVVGGVWSWTGSQKAPLSPRDTFVEIAKVLAPYGITRIHVDSWSFDAMADHARAAGLYLVEHLATERDLAYQRLRVLLGAGDLELPPDPVLRTDLLAIRQRATANGVKIHLPRTANGRHCDFAPSVALAALHAERNAPFDWYDPYESRNKLGLNEPPLEHQRFNRWDGYGGKGFG